MKKLRCFSLILILILNLPPILCFGSGDALVERLQAFDRLLMPDADSDSIETEGQKDAALFQLRLQFQTLQSQIKRSEFAEARQTLRRGGFFRMPQGLREDWLELMAEVEAELARREANQLAEWSAQVDRLVDEARQACLSAETAGDLDSVLIRCAALQMVRPNGRDVISDRTFKKINGTAFLLERWASYLDNRKTGRIEQANTVLQRLKQDKSHFPILTAKEINARIVNAQEIELLDGWGQVIEIIDMVVSPADIPDALAKLEVLQSEVDSDELRRMQKEVEKLSLLARAARLAGNRQIKETTRLLGKLERMSGSVDTKPNYMSLANQITDGLLASEAQHLAEIEPRPNESTDEFSMRAMGSLFQAEKWVELLELMEVHSALRTDSSAVTQQSAALKHYLTAQRFEKAGDPLSALMEYRAFVSASWEGQEFVPIAQAEAALTRLGKANPELIKDVNTVILHEIRDLKAKLRRVPPHSGIRPY